MSRAALYGNRTKLTPLDTSRLIKINVIINDSASGRSAIQLFPVLWKQKRFVIFVDLTHTINVLE